MSSRSDQLRDKDKIQRKTIVADLMQGVVPHVYIGSDDAVYLPAEKFGHVTLDLCEPAISNNAYSPKFSFRVIGSSQEIEFKILEELLSDIKNGLVQAKKEFFLNKSRMKENQSLAKQDADTTPDSLHKKNK